jgi:hypothetical protein
MADTTFEEASRCPKCNQPGQVSAQGKVLRHGAGELKTVYCRNSRCEWLDTSWIVQINADGTIPEPTLDRDKSFPTLPDRTNAVQAQMQRLYDQTITGGETR